jgi:NitT/TauT family transport system permease protein
MKNGLPKLTVFTLFITFLFWELICVVFKIPEYLLPSPYDVLAKIYQKWDVLLAHSWVTLREIIAGFGIGVVTGFIIAVGISSSKKLSEILYPLLVITQVVPKIALAPLFLIWFGYGLLPKIIIAALISFFPIVINMTVGLTDIDHELLDLMKSISATRYQVFRKIRIPNAIPYIFSSLKISILFSIVGAITGEFVGADKGLGYLIIIGNTTFDTSLLFASLTVISLIGILCFVAISTLQNVISEAYGGAFITEREVITST